MMAKYSDSSSDLPKISQDDMNSPDIEETNKDDNALLRQALVRLRKESISTMNRTKQLESDLEKVTNALKAEQLESQANRVLAEEWKLKVLQYSDKASYHRHKKYLLNPSHSNNNNNNNNNDSNNSNNKNNNKNNNNNNNNENYNITPRRQSLSDIDKLKSVDVVALQNENMMLKNEKIKLETRIKQVEGLLSGRNRLITELQKQLQDMQHLQMGTYKHQRKDTPGGYKLHQQQTGSVLQEANTESETTESSPITPTTPMSNIKTNVSNAPMHDAFKWHESQANKNNFGIEKEHMEQTQQPNDSQILQMLRSADSLLKTSNNSLQKNRKELKIRLERKIMERPTIHEMLSRGLLQVRPDTNLDHGIWARARDLNKRRASLTVEKLIENRPSPKDIKNKGILLDNEMMESNAHRKRRISQQLDFRLNPNRRPSITNKNGIPGASPRSIASLFFNEPKSGSLGLEAIPHGNFNSQIASLFSSPHAPIDNEKEKRRRLEMKYRQRPTVSEMCSRGLLFDHPTISPELIKRARIRGRRKAKNRIKLFLEKRPKISELQQRNILQKEDVLIKRQHKHHLSADLEKKIELRPSLHDLKQMGLTLQLSPFDDPNSTNTNEKDIEPLVQPKHSRNLKEPEEDHKHEHKHKHEHEQEQEYEPEERQPQRSLQPQQSPQPQEKEEQNKQEKQQKQQQQQQRYQQRYQQEEEEEEEEDTTTIPKSKEQTYVATNTKGSSSTLQEIKQKDTSVTSIEENLTIEDLKQEIRRLQQTIADTSAVKRHLEDENHSLRHSLKHNHLQDDSEYRELLKRHSIAEENSLNRIAEEIDKSGNDYKLIEQTEKELINLSQDLIKCTEWAYTLVWPEHIKETFATQIDNLKKEHDKNFSVQFLQDAFSQISVYVQEANKQKNEHLRELEILRKKFKKSMHVSMTNLEFEDVKTLKEEAKRAREDKLTLLHSTQSEIDRLREEIRHITKMQRSKEPVSTQSQQSQPPQQSQQPQQSQSQSSYLGWALTRVWTR